jgi:hypothetical protein
MTVHCVCNFVTGMINGDVHFYFSFIICQCVTLEFKLFLFVFSHARFPIPFCEFFIVFVEEFQVFWSRILCDFRHFKGA